MSNMPPVSARKAGGFRCRRSGSLSSKAGLRTGRNTAMATKVPVSRKCTASGGMAFLDLPHRTLGLVHRLGPLHVQAIGPIKMSGGGQNGPLLLEGSPGVPGFARATAQRRNLRAWGEQSGRRSPLAACGFARSLVHTNLATVASAVEWRSANSHPSSSSPDAEEGSAARQGAAVPRSAGPLLCIQERSWRP